MKKIILTVCLISCMCAVSGCKKKGVVTFCEGEDESGKGVNCGTVFTTGDLTAIFNSKSAFGTDNLELKIYNINDGSRKAFNEMNVPANSDATEGKAFLEMYDEGTFRVVLQKHDGEVVSEGNIEIVDTYTKP